MVVNDENYKVTYDEATATVAFEGFLRLFGTEDYAPIFNLLDAAAIKKHSLITLDLCKLVFLNSAGLNTITKFFIKVRDLKASQVIVRGSSNYSWQARSFKNLERILPGLKVEIV